MVQATFIEASEAEKPKRSDARRDGRMKGYDEFVAEVIKNAPKVAKVQPDGATSVRGERLRVAQAITRYNKANPATDGKLASWTGPEGFVYVQFQPATSSTNGNGEPNGEPASEEATSAPAERGTRRAGR